MPTLHHHSSSFFSSCFFQIIIIISRFLCEHSQIIGDLDARKRVLHQLQQDFPRRRNETVDQHQRLARLVRFAGLASLARHHLPNVSLAGALESDYHAVVFFQGFLGDLDAVRNLQMILKDKKRTLELMIMCLKNRCTLEK